MRHKHALLLIVVLGALAVFPSGAGAATPLSGPGKLAVGVEVLRFNAVGKTATATGQVTANLTDNAGHVTTVKTQIAITAASGSNCKILHLFLNELTLQLLGLNAHLDKVTLDITGDPRGGVLGSLFCRLARAKLASHKASLARALTRGVQHGHGHALRFTANLNPVARTSQAPVCPVLDLVVGPLNLQLLGLIVDLQKVHLVVTATPGGGALGNLFCNLSK